MDASTSRDDSVIVSPENTKYLIKVPSSNDFLTIFTSWLPELIEIKILNNSNNSQSSGILMIEDIKSSAKDLEISFEQFYNECKDALITNGGLENFLYSIENNKFIIQKNDTFKITYLEINIIETTTENLKDFFINESINIINSMRENLLKLQSQCIIDNNDYKELEKSCKKFIEEKNCLEKNLLSKFLVLLNSKKDKITQLQAEIDKNKVRRPSNTDNDDDNINEIDENDDAFSLPTQKMIISSESSQLTQTQLKCINLPKRNANNKPSTNNVVNLPQRDVPSCSHNYPSTAITDFNENEMESQEIFKDM